MKRSVSLSEVNNDIDEVKEGTVEENQDQESREEEMKECVICLCAKSDHALIPCGHLCVCKNDGKYLVQKKMKCPICRKKIDGVIKIYS